MTPNCLKLNAIYTCTLHLIFFLCFITIPAHANQSQYAQYTVLNENQYRQTIKTTRAKVQRLLNALQTYRHQNTNAQVAYIAQQLADIPYLPFGAMGEGDWQPLSFTYQPGAQHIKQFPVYRLDGLDCQTFVQIVMALLHANNLAQFDQTLLKIAYGAAGNPYGEIVRYYNRNNFIEGDFNPINQKNGWLTDVTSQGVLAPYTKVISATLNRQNWFLKQQENLAENVNVLSSQSGPAMVKRFTTVYSHLSFPHFLSERVTMTYLPKNTLAIRQKEGSYQLNQALFDKIPAPAVAEIIRDPKKWMRFGMKIKNNIGTETVVSHLGLLYRQTFNRGELMYRHINCGFGYQHKKICQVTSIICKKDKCRELMFAHATDAYPDDFYYYQQPNGHYVCSPQAPAPGVKWTKCNRIVRMPLFDYLTDVQFGYYRLMDNPSILGIHVEVMGSGSGSSCSSLTP